MTFLNSVWPWLLDNYTPTIDITDAPEIEATQLNTEEEIFLDTLTDYPFIPVTERRALLGWDERKYSGVVNGLIQKNTLRKVRVSVGRGGPTTLYEIVGQNPGIKHQYFVHWIETRIRSRKIDCQTFSIGPDIIVPSLNLAIQVELGKSKIQDNIRLAQENCSGVVVCSDDEKLIQRLSQQNEDESIRSSLVLNVPELVDSMRKDAGLFVR